MNQTIWKGLVVAALCFGCSETGQETGTLVEGDVASALADDSGTSGDADGTNYGGFQSGDKDAQGAVDGEAVDGETTADTTPVEEDSEEAAPDVVEPEDTSVDAEGTDVASPAEDVESGTDVAEEDSGSEEEDVAAVPDVVEDVQEAPDVGEEVPDVEEEDALVVFSEPVPVSEPYGYGEGWLYSLTVNDIGQVGVLWSGSEDVPFGQTAPAQKLLFSLSDPEVTEFEAPILIAEEIAPGDNEGDVLQDNEDLLFTWKAKTGSSTSIVFRRAQGPSLEGDDLVVATATGSETVYRPYFIRKTQTDFCIAYQRTVSNSARVELVCSDSAGLAFGEPKQVNPPNLSGYVSSGLYTANQELVVAYHGHEFGSTGNKIYIQVSGDDGDTFEPPVVLSAFGPEGTNVGPSLALGPGKVYASWEHSAAAQYSAWFTSTTDLETWEAPAELPGLEMSVQLRTGTADVVYATSKVADINPLLAKAGFVRSGDGGATWGELYPIDTVGDGFILDHDIVANRKKNLLHMVWWQYYDGSLQDQAFYVMTIEDQEVP